MSSIIETIFVDIFVVYEVFSFAFTVFPLQPLISKIAQFIDFNFESKRIQIFNFQHFISIVYSKIVRFI